MIKKFFKLIFSDRALAPWMMAIAAAPMILVAIFSYRIAVDIIEHTVYTKLLTSIQKNVEIIDSYISERSLNLVQITELPELKTILDRALKHGQDRIINKKDMKLLHKYFQSLSPRLGVNNMYIISASGKVIYEQKTTDMLGEILSPNIISHQEIYQAFDGARVLRYPYLSKYYRSDNKQKSRLYLSNPIYEKGHVRAVFVLNLEPKKIEQVVYKQLSYGQSAETILASSFLGKPVVVAYSKNEQDISLFKTPSPQIMDFLSRAIRGTSDAPVEFMENGTRKIAVYRYVPYLNMGMLLQFDSSEVFRESENLKLSMIILIALSLFIVGVIVYWVSRNLWQANQRGKKLLESILPKLVIDELNDKKYFAARNVDDVSIIFADIVNFTGLASSEPPETVVKILNEIFLGFDKIVDKYKLEKIKTVGDAYMAAAGLMNKQEDHANRAVDCALEMIVLIKHFNLDHNMNLALRIGVDSGTVTAGIVGEKKFIYDVWGHTVNKASRMQTTGLPNTVQITKDTYDALKNKSAYKIVSERREQVKGLGEVDSFLIDKADIRFEL